MGVLYEYKVLEKGRLEILIRRLRGSQTRWQFKLLLDDKLLAEGDGSDFIRKLTAASIALNQVGGYDEEAKHLKKLALVTSAVERGDQEEAVKLAKA